MENKCVVFYEYWQMECCGTGFEKGQDVKWLVEKRGTKSFHNGIADRPGYVSMKTPDEVDYTFDNHNDDYRELLVLEGTVSEVKGCYRDPKFETFGKVIDGNDSLDVIQKVDGMEMEGYLVTISDYKTRPAEKSEVTFYMGREPEATEIEFSRPELLGTIMTVTTDTSKDELEIFPTEGRALTEGFLDRLLAGESEFSLKDSDGSEYTMNFDSSEMIIRGASEDRHIPVSLKQFKAAFLDTVREYSMYYAAPCNYPAFFFMGYDKMISSFEKYRSKEAAILAKLPKK